MSFIIDTSVWFLALRRKKVQHFLEVECLERLIRDEEPIFLLGIILQELLQGLKSQKSFKALAHYLKPFPILEPAREDYIFAAELMNHCRSHGVQASTVDFLIAATCIHHQCNLLTTDGDFNHIAKHSSLKIVSMK